MGFLQDILHTMTGGIAPQPASKAVPATGIMQVNGHFTAPAPRTFQMNLPQVQSPQNLSQYGNAQGQHWMENDQGQKFGMPQLQPYNSVGDQRIVPTSNHYNRPAIAAPQWQSVQQPQLRTQII